MKIDVLRSCDYATQGQKVSCIHRVQTFNLMSGILSTQPDQPKLAKNPSFTKCDTTQRKSQAATNVVSNPNHHSQPRPFLLRVSPLLLPNPESSIVDSPPAQSHKRHSICDSAVPKSCITNRANSLPGSRRAGRQATNPNTLRKAS